jgi:FkbM family methyltransferase
VFTRKALNAGASKVVAIEPAPENLACLRRNFAAEIARGSVVVVPKGVWDSETELTMHVDTDHSAADSFVRPLAGATVQVMRLPVTTIDNLVRELGLRSVDFIKMDIEGSERRAIVGAKRTISAFRPRMAICVYHLPDDPLVIPQAVDAVNAGYRAERSCLLEADRVEPQVMHFY